MNKFSKKRVIFLAATLGTVSTQAFGENADLENLANTIVSNYPAIHQFLEGLAPAKIDQICSNDFGQIQDSDEFELLLNLSANIQNNSQDLCVIRELQSMIGFAEAHGNGSETPNGPSM